MGLVGTVLVIAGVVGFPALHGAAAEPPFDETLSDNCGYFGVGPEGSGVEKILSVSGTGDLRTVAVQISWQGGPAQQVVDCIAVGNQASGVVHSVTQEDPPNGFSVTFSIGLAGSDADLIIAEGDQVCDIAVVNLERGGGVSDVFCTDPITFATTTTTTGPGATPGPNTTGATTTTTRLGATPGPTTTGATTTTVATTTSTTRPSTRPTLPATGRPHAGVVAGGVLALLAGATALVLARRST